MATGILIPALAYILVAALIFAAIDDWRRRIIENWLNAGIALAAPLWWWANGWSLWPGAAMQIGIAALALAVFLVFFVVNAMGGGDVKLITVLGLWFPLDLFVQFLIMMAIAGGVLTLAMLIRHRIKKDRGPVQVPYGVAISFAAIWVLLRTIS
jgi:prepilin peptidase CpaA